MFTLYEVGTVKDVDGIRTYVSVDGGMSDNIRTALYGASYSATLASRASAAGPMLARVVGKHCESGDIVVQDEFLPADVRPGDLLAVPGTGAYCRSMASNYNHVPRPPVVAVADGQARVIVRRETEEDLCAGLDCAEWMGRRGTAGAAGLRHGRLQVVRLLHEQADDLAARIGAPVELVGIAVRRPGRDRGDAAGRPGAVHHRRARPGQARRRGRGGGGGRRHGAGPHLAGRGAAAPARAWSPPTRRCSPRTAAALHDGGGRGRRGPLLRGRGRRRDPAAAAAARVAARGPDHPGDGIVNGTTNFILSAMDATGAGYTEALEEATALGYAEADPTADVEGFDAAAKAAILASLAFHTRVTAADVLPRGDHRGHRRRRGQRPGDGLRRSSCCASPTRSDGGGQRPGAPGDDPAQPPAGRVGDAFNAVFVEADAAGQLMFYGRGAGGAPTASAVLGDLVAVARNRLRRRSARPASRRTPTCRCGRWVRWSPATTSAWTWPTGRRAGRGGRGLRPARRVDRDRAPDRAGRARRPW